MSIRSSNMKVTFCNRFFVPGFQEELPAGDYDIGVEEELLRGLSFDYCRKRTSYQKSGGKFRQYWQIEIRLVTQYDLSKATTQDDMKIWNDKHIEMGFPLRGEPK